MRLPRDVDFEDLLKPLRRYGYTETRQTGSHIRLTTLLNGEHHITIPRHHPLRVGTLQDIRDCQPSEYGLADFGR